MTFFVEILPTRLLPEHRHGDYAAHRYPPLSVRPHAGASERTLARLFEQDLGMTFGVWRQQMRLAHAAPLIARGLPLSHVASELGYASQSAFSAMFKKTFGLSPSAFFAQERN